MELNAVKSEQRIRYESEMALIQRKYGTLEDMRHRLGLSQRKMAELLMVDPSAWTRWTKGQGEKVPPHVYRALAWYMELQEFRQSVRDANSVNVAPPSPKNIETAVSKVDFEAVKGEIENEWAEKMAAMQSRYEKELAVTYGWKLFLILNTAAILYLIFSN